MSKTATYDLEDRTFQFAKQVRLFVRKIPKDLCNIEDSKQLIRASGSVGANYVEANEALSKKDFRVRLKISRKEAKESRYWLKLIDIQNNHDLKREQRYLIQESTELLKILSSIINKTN